MREFPWVVSHGWHTVRASKASHAYGKRVIGFKIYSREAPACSVDLGPSRFRFSSCYCPVVRIQPKKKGASWVISTIVASKVQGFKTREFLGLLSMGGALSWRVQAYKRAIFVGKKWVLFLQQVNPVALCQLPSKRRAC